MGFDANTLYNEVLFLIIARRTNLKSYPVSYFLKKIGTVFTTLHFLLNLGMGPIS
jgi:hypothetical protein